MSTTDDLYKTQFNETYGKSYMRSTQRCCCGHILGAALIQ